MIQGKSGDAILQIDIFLRGNFVCSSSMNHKWRTQLLLEFLFLKALLRKYKLCSFTVLKLTCQNITKSFLIIILISQQNQIPFQLALTCIICFLEQKFVHIKATIQGLSFYIKQLFWFYFSGIKIQYTSRVALIQATRAFSYRSYLDYNRNNNNNQALVLKILGSVIDPQQTSQGEPHVFFSAILFYLKSYFTIIETSC